MRRADDGTHGPVRQVARAKSPTGACPSRPGNTQSQEQAGAACRGCARPSATVVHPVKQQQHRQQRQQRARRRGLSRHCPREVRRAELPMTGPAMAVQRDHVICPGPVRLQGKPRGLGDYGGGIHLVVCRAGSSGHAAWIVVTPHRTGCGAVHEEQAGQDHDHNNDAGPAPPHRPRCASHVSRPRPSSLASRTETIPHGGV